MRIYSKIVINIATGELMRVSYRNYDGPVLLFKGPSEEEKNLQAKQAEFYDTLTKDYKAAFDHQTAILQAMDKAWMPILDAGINQYGFSTAEDKTLRSQAIEGTAQSFKNAQVALNNRNVSPAGPGGEEIIPSGATAQLNEELAAGTASTESNQLLDITKAGYQTGRQNYIAASEALGGVAKSYDPTAYISGANQAGSGAFSSADIINKEQQASSAWSVVGGVLGGAASSFLDAASGGISGDVGSAVSKVGSGNWGW